MKKHTDKPGLPGARRALTTLALCALAGLSGGCSTPGGWAPVQGVPVNGGWLEIQGSRLAMVAPGVVLEMPDTVYRARFSDAQGIYYQASQPLRYRSAFGVVTLATGGLYVKHGRTDPARSWTESFTSSPRMEHRQAFAFRLHPAP